MEISSLIRELNRIQEKFGEVDVRIGETGYGNHTYAINEFMTTPTEPEEEHTCDGAECICTEDSGVYRSEVECPLCDCAGCNENEGPNTVWLMKGDQDAYSLPSELVSTDD